MKENKVEKINKFLAILASIATIVSVFLGYQLSIESKQNIVSGDNNGQMINTDSYINQVIDDSKNYSEAEILKKAEIAVGINDYAGAMKLYSLDKVKENDVTYNNIGYMYANGMGVDKNIELAIKYYDLAIQKNNAQSKINKFVCLVNNIEEHNNYEDVLYKYINDSLKDNQNPIYAKFKEENGGEAVKSVSKNFLGEYCEGWKDTGNVIKVTDRPTNKMFTIYYWISTNTTTDGNQYQIWGEQKRHFILKDYFDDKLIYLDV